jgi:TPR repeat protein
MKTKLSRLLRVLAVCLTMLAVPAHSIEDDDVRTLMREANSSNQQALVKLRAAATEGHRLAQFYLGHLHLQGRVTRQDTPEAIGWLEKSAKQGYLPAMHDLGVIHERAPGELRNEREAWRQSGATRLRRPIWASSTSRVAVG